MRQVKGRVFALEGRLATVEVSISEGGCGRCHEPGGCGGANLSNALSSKLRYLTVENSLNFGIGDPVTVGIEEASVSEIATRVYALPLIGLIAGGAIGDSWLGAGGSAPAIVGAVSGFLMAIAISRYVLTPIAPQLRMLDTKVPHCSAPR